MNVGSSIRRVREVRRYSQEYMANQLGMSQNNYSRIEKDEVKIDVERLRKIAEILQVDCQSIINFDEQRINDSILAVHTNDSEVTMTHVIESFSREREQLKEQIRHLHEEIEFNRKTIKELLRGRNQG